MLWGGISWRRRVPHVIFQNNGVGRGGVVTARRYVGERLQSVLVPFMAGRRGMVFQQDNAKVHSARNNIVTMDWPALSRDLNPIEYLWDETERRIH